MKVQFLPISEHHTPQNIVLSLAVAGDKLQYQSNTPLIAEMALGTAKRARNELAISPTGLSTVCLPDEPLLE
jgi:hypothetical protein